MLLHAGYAGSKLYNLVTSNSDEDIRGIFIEPADVFFSLDTFDYYEDIASDTVLFSLRRFMQMALKNNPNTMDILFAHNSTWVTSTPEWAEIYRSRRHIISQKMISATKGFVYQEYTNWLKDKTNRIDQLEKYGYDGKMISHVMRLLFQAESVRHLGMYSPTLWGSERRVVYEMKTGQMSRKQIQSWIDPMIDQWTITYPLQVEPNYDVVNALVSKLQRQALKL